MKIILIVIVGLIVVVLGIGLAVGPGMSSSLSGFRSEPKGTPVRMEAVEFRDLIATVSAPGGIEPHTKVEISAEISSRIEELPFEEGQEVRKGEIVVKLDDRNLKATLDSARARSDGERYRLQSEQARLVGLLSNLSFAQKELDRTKALYETGDVSRKDLDQAEERVADLSAGVEASKYNISVSESSLAAADADIARAEDGLSKCVISAPIDGVITALNAEIGEVVLVGTMNNPGTVILTIADLSRMILNAQVSETDIAHLEEGQAAKVYINAYPDEVYSGVVRKIALQRSTATDGSGFFATEVEIDLRGDRIRSGLAANVDIEVATFNGAVVQSQAIVERLIEDLPNDIIRNAPFVDMNKRNTAVVYRVVDGKAVATPVKSGASDLTHTLIVEGLEAGDVVIVGPYKVLETIEHDEAVQDEEAIDQEDDAAESDENEVNNEGSPEPQNDTADDTDSVRDAA